MSDVDSTVRWILSRASIRNKLVVLCEGQKPPHDDHAPRSPQAYARLQSMPDANFYYAAIPRNWHGDRLPRFFNCGGRSDVLATFTALHAAHAQDAGSYLNPDKLYALIDLDVQMAQLPQKYRWNNTEAVHEALYDDGTLKTGVDDGHRIWVTAFVHKEAFFVLPGAVSAWIRSGAMFRGHPIDLNTFYEAIAQGLEQDGDVTCHLDIVRARLHRFLHGRSLSCNSAQDIATSWRAAHAAANHAQQESLLRALVSVAKVKPFWNEINPAGNMDPVQFRDQLMLDIARHLSDLSPADHPLPAFFMWLKSKR